MSSEDGSQAPADADRLARLAEAVRAIERGGSPAGDPASRPAPRRSERARPAAAGTQPGAAGEQSGEAGGPAGAAGEQPGAAGEQSGEAREQPGTASEQPGTAGADSGAAREQPGTAGEQPGAPREQPRAGGEQPREPEKQPGVRAGASAALEEPVAAARRVLADGGAPEALAPSAVAALGERAAERLREDPWQVLAVPGVRAEQADAFARSLLGGGFAPDDERRGLALVGRLLDAAAEAGHTVLGWSALAAALGRHAVPDPDGTLRRAVEDGRVMVFRDEPADGDEEAPVALLLGLDRYALAEESLADGLMRLLGTFQDAGAEPLPEPSGLPTPSAAELVRAASGSGLVVHSGGEAARAEPAALVAVARAAGLRAYAAAYTADGRRRLAAALGPGDAQAAVTVEGLLSGREGPERSEDGTLALDLLAVLDTPELDAETAATVVESVPDGARLVLSGDPNVLWSAGPGRVFADLLAAKVCPQVVSRTPDPGPIGELVSAVGAGELPAVDAPGREVVIVPVRNAGEAVHRAVQLVADSVPRALGVPAEQTQVITVGHGGGAGTRALNAALKERLNPGPGRFAGFDPGDRVVYVPAPGRVLPARVVAADAAGLRLDADGTAVVVPREQVAAAVRHGWAVTAHQAVGMRWPAAVAVLPGDAAAALTRSWVYTAFSRGERHLSVVHGVEQALARAVAGEPAKERTTRLRAILREQSAG